jgi:hypothetical protein
MSEQPQTHGHVTPRRDGAKNRCGGPACCSDCARELAAQDARLFGDGWLRVDAEGRMRRADPVLLAITQAPDNRHALDPDDTPAGRP